MADSLLRNRERVVAIDKAKHTIQVTTNVPKPIEAVCAAKLPKGRAVPSAAYRCKATKLDGKQCPFKRSGCSDFCTKHAVKKTLA
jgi:hypothetical protein